MQGRLGINPPLPLLYHNSYIKSQVLVASVDGIVRAAYSPLATFNSTEVDRLTTYYFASKVHNSLLDFAQEALGIKEERR